MTASGRKKTLVTGSYRPEAVSRLRLFRHGNLPGSGQLDVVPMYRFEYWSVLFDKTMSLSTLLRPAHRG